MDILLTFTAIFLGLAVAIVVIYVVILNNPSSIPTPPTPDPPTPDPPTPDLELNIWPSLGYDRKNTGRTVDNGPLGSSVTAKWTYDPGSANNSTAPAIDKDGIIYVTYNAGIIRAVNPDGTEKWSNTLDPFGIINTSPTIGNNGDIYFGSVQGNIYSIKSSDGFINWFYATSGAINRSAKVGNDGTIYINSADNNLYALNPDGTEKWRYTAIGDLFGSPAIASNGNIYIGSNDNNVYLINSEDGTMINSITPEASRLVRGTPSIANDGTVYIGADNILYAIDAGLDNILWSFTTGSNIFTSASIGVDGTIYLSSDKLYAINPDGTEKWSFTQATLFAQNIVDNNGIIYAGSSEFNNLNLYAVNPDGTLKWSYLTMGSGDSMILSAPSIDKNNIIYVVPRDGKLYALE